MLRILVKMGPAGVRNKEWTCLFGLHVRTATIMIGLWHLFLNIMALGILAIIIKNPTMMQELENGYDTETHLIDFDAPALPTPLSKIDPPYAYRDHTLNYNQNVDMGGLVCICMIAITLMLIYGAVKGKPSHLLPFFCLQLFDFAITTLTAAGYICYLRSVHHIIAENHRLPWREELLKLSPQTLSILVLLAFIAVILLKAYAIGIVWRCYKYLTIRQHSVRSMLPYIIPEVAVRQDRDYNTLLPDYEEAIAQSMKQPPPPSYQVAISSTSETPENTTSDTTTDVQNNLTTTNIELTTSTPPPYAVTAPSTSFSVDPVPFATTTTATTTTTTDTTFISSTSNTIAPASNSAVTNNTNITSNILQMSTSAATTSNNCSVV